jgi:hypothetical protein
MFCASLGKHERVGEASTIQPEYFGANSSIMEKQINNLNYY